MLLQKFVYNATLFTTSIETVEEREVLPWCYCISVVCQWFLLVRWTNLSSNSLQGATKFNRVVDWTANMWRGNKHLFCWLEISTVNLTEKYTEYRVTSFPLLIEFCFVYFHENSNNVHFCLKVYKKLVFN